MNTNVIAGVFGFAWWAFMGVVTTPFVLVYAAVRFSVILVVALLQLPMRYHVFILVVVYVLSQAHNFKF